MSRYYVLHDYNKNIKCGAKNVSKLELPFYNKNGFGCFWTPNDFNGARKAENLVKINFWVADIDDGTKEEQMERINILPLKPSTIVETKKGYHCYWKAEDATLDNYRDIELGLIEKLKADKHCKDVSRLLRCPGYFHMKDPKNPFLVKVIYKDDRSFTEKKMLFCYKLPKVIYKKIDYKGDKKDFLDESKWDRIFKLNTIGEGCRNAEFSRIAFWLKDEGFSHDIVLNTIQRMNQKISRPLDNWEIKTLVNSKF